MSRKIYSEQSEPVTSGGTFQLPAGVRLIKVQGEADGKPTYDFSVRINGHNGANTTSNGMRYVGAKNGRHVHLWNEWPQVPTTTSTPAAQGQFQLEVVAGTDVSLRVFYNDSV